MTLPDRQHLYHDTPPWVANGACFFVTICATPRGENQLATPADAPAILASSAHYHELRTWWVHLFLLMPDHAHALLVVAPNKTLENTIRAWKSWQVKTLGIKWQKGFFDHRLRSDESFEEKTNYIRHNPVRAGLVARAEDWRYVWE